jgi:hypothetical protein
MNTIKLLSVVTVSVVEKIVYQCFANAMISLPNGLTRKSRAKANPAWDKLNAQTNGEYDARILEIRQMCMQLTRTEAMNSVLAERGCDCMDTALILGVSDRTVHNHHWHVRQKSGKTRKNIPFHTIFLSETLEQTLRQKT